MNAIGYELQRNRGVANSPDRYIAGAALGAIPAGAGAFLYISNRLKDEERKKFPDVLKNYEKTHGKTYLQHMIDTSDKHILYDDDDEILKVYK